MRATTRPAAATGRVSPSTVRRSSPAISTSPRFTVSPGFTRACPAVTLIDTITASSSATRLPASDNAYTSGASSARRARTDRQTPSAFTPKNAYSGCAAESAMPMASMFSVRFPAPGRTPISSSVPTIAASSAPVTEITHTRPESRYKSAAHTHSAGSSAARARRNRFSRAAPFAPRTR